MTAKAALCQALLNGEYSLKDLIGMFKATKDVDERLKIANTFLDTRNKLPKGIPKILSYPNYPTEYEIFEDVNGYEGQYQIGNWGTFISLEGFFIKNRKGGNNKMAVYCEKKQRVSGKHQFGYPNITLWKNGVVQYISIHRLVALHFIPNPEFKPQVLHKDDNAVNPRWNNLEWGTQSKNIQDASDRNRGFRGVKNGMSKLKEAEIPKIRELISKGISSRKIAEMFGVTKTPILWIKNNKSWKHVK